MQPVEIKTPVVPQAPAPAAPSRTPGERGTILVVDDEPMVVRAVEQILTRQGFAVVTADAPSAALSRFQERSGGFDLLLTDVVMPEGGGRRLADRLRELDPGLRVLFMSGYTEHDSVRDDRELPAPLLSKPFSADRLRAAIEHALES